MSDEGQQAPGCSSTPCIKVCSCANRHPSKKKLGVLKVMKLILAVWRFRKSLVLSSRSPEVVSVHLENATFY